MFSMTRDVQYSEVGVDGRCRLHQLMNYLQDCSTGQSESIGKGMAYLEQHSRAWLVMAWQLRIAGYPALHEHIEVSTWPHSFTKLCGNRNFSIKDSAGEYMVKADSIWCLVDTNTGQPIRIGEEDKAGYQLSGKLDMPPTSRKLDILTDGEAMPEFVVRRVDLDTNHHVNNANYIAFAEEYLPETFKPSVFRVQYRKAALHGDVICPLVKREGSCIYIGLNDRAGEPYVSMEFEEEVKGL